MISREGMIEVDRIMVEDLGIGVELMMEHAGLNLAKIVMKYYDEKKYKSLVIIAGKGNNGGGGLVAARKLAGWVSEDIPLYVIIPKEIKPDSVPGKQLHRLKQVGVPTMTKLPHNIENPLVIDAFIGYNFKGAIRSGDSDIFQYLKDYPVISLDIASGIDSNTGNDKAEIHPIATVTLAWPKQAFSKISSVSVGEIYLVDIGIPFHVFSNDLLPSSISHQIRSSIGKNFSKYSYQKIYCNSQGWEFSSNYN